MFETDYRKKKMKARLSRSVRIEATGSKYRSSTIVGYKGTPRNWQNGVENHDVASSWCETLSATLLVIFRIVTTIAYVDISSYY